MSEIHLNECEEEVVRFLAKRFHDGGSRISVSELVQNKKFNLDEEKAELIIARFINFDWIQNDSYQAFAITPLIMGVADQIENPIPVDYWRKLSIWFRSKWWSIPFLVLFFVVPALVHWAEMFLKLIRFVWNLN